VAIELPGEVVQLLQFIGVNWPNINEDKVREAGQHVREFAENIQGTHDAATSAIHNSSQHYQGAGYEAMVAAWGQKSSDHMHELIDICHVVATALDGAADVIVTMKGAAIAELVALAASFVADQAAAVATFGAAEAALVLIEEAATKCVEFLEQQLIQYIIGQVIEAAINPLIGVVDKAMDGLMYSALSAALDVPAPSGGGGGEGLKMSVSEFKAHAQVMSRHAATIAGHAQALHSNLSGMSFE
jgi:uncharacterized protein YukE